MSGFLSTCFLLASGGPSLLTISLKTLLCTKSTSPDFSLFLLPRSNNFGQQSTRFLFVSWHDSSPFQDGQKFFLESYKRNKCVCATYHYFMIFGMCAISWLEWFTKPMFYLKLLPSVALPTHEMSLGMSPPKFDQFCGYQTKKHFPVPYHKITQHGQPLHSAS